MSESEELALKTDFSKQQFSKEQVASKVWLLAATAGSGRGSQRKTRNRLWSNTMTRRLVFFIRSRWVRFACMHHEYRFLGPAVCWWLPRQPSAVAVH